MMADFDWCLAPLDGRHVVLIVDRDCGGPSVTNTAEAVLTKIRETVPKLEQFEIFYRDSMGQWDMLRPMIRGGRISNVYFKRGEKPGPLLELLFANNFLGDKSPASNRSSGDKV